MFILKQSPNHDFSTSHFIPQISPNSDLNHDFSCVDPSQITEIHGIDASRCRAQVLHISGMQFGHFGNVLHGRWLLHGSSLARLVKRGSHDLPL